jgi:hypothetical protein
VASPAITFTAPRSTSDGLAPFRPLARRSWFRMTAPSGGQPRRKGVGSIRSAVERGHAFLAQFGRIVRRTDRRSRRYLGWIELASALIYLRHEANGFPARFCLVNGPGRYVRV